MASSTLKSGGLIYDNSNTSKAKAVTITSDYGATLKASDYPSGIVTINASSRTKAINIAGNSKANKILGSSGNDTLIGAAGNDTLTGGAGNDIFIFDGKGSDVITDYTAGDDTLKISSGSISSYSFSGKDATFKIGSGSVKISDGKNSAITVVDSKNKLQTYDGGLIYDSTVAKAKALTVSAAYGNTLASYGASVVTIDASSRNKALEITGNAAANKITGTSANDTINGGGGNDTLTGGKGNDIFVYEAGGGNDVITDYAAGSDTIKIASGEISGYSISGADATFKIDKGSLKVSGGKNSAITIIDANGNSGTYQNGAIYNNAQTSKATAITLTAAYGNTYTASTTIITVDASERKNAINITGNTKNNFLIGGAGKDILDGGAGNDSLSGGKGADVLTGGKGADVFIYADGDGTDAITDYVAGEDIIKLTSGAVKSYSVKDNDAIFKIGSGAITLKGAGKDAISILDANDVLTVYNGGLIYNNSRISKADAVTITSDYDGEFHTYGASVETIDAAARTKAIEITGNGADNFILGGKGKDIISGGKGDDTIYAGKGNDLLSGGKGADVFYFGGADGNDTITDYSAGDIISVGGSVSYSTKNSDAILKIGSGNVTLQNAAETAITIVGADSVASIYSGKNISTETYTGSAEIAETVTVEVEVTVPVGGTVPAGGSIIAGTSGNDTLFGTTGNDTFTGYAGNDIFIYNGGGDLDVITDYGTGSDKISIGANSISGAMLVGNDMLFAIGSGVLKLTGAKNKKVTIASNSGESVYLNGEIDTVPAGFTGVSLTPDDDSYTVTVSKQIIYALAGNDTITNQDLANVVIFGGDDNDYIRNSYGSSVTIDGGAGSDYIDNYSSSNVTISGGAGSDYIRSHRSSNVTIDGGVGNDSIKNNDIQGNIYQLSSGTGTDTIWGYNENDTIYVAASGYTTSQSGENFVITTGSDSLIIRHAINFPITVKNSSGTVRTYNSNGTRVINGDTSGSEIINTNSLVTIKGSSSQDSISNYGSNVKIDGGAGKDYIYNSSIGDSVTIDGGTGDDTIYMNSYTTLGNVFQYADGDGNDIVYNLSSYDTLRITDGTYSTTKSGDNVIVNVGSGKITLVGAANISPNIVGTETPSTVAASDEIKAWISEQYYAPANGDVQTYNGVDYIYSDGEWIYETETAAEDATIIDAIYLEENRTDGDTIVIDDVEFTYSADIGEWTYETETAADDATVSAIIAEYYSPYDGDIIVINDVEYIYDAANETWTLDGVAVKSSLNNTISIVYLEENLQDGDIMTYNGVEYTYSEETGEWTYVATETADKDAIDAAYLEVNRTDGTTVTVEDVDYTYSAETGEWTCFVIEAADAEAAEAIIAEYYSPADGDTVTVGGVEYTYRAETGDWIYEMAANENYFEKANSAIADLWFAQDENFMAGDNLDFLIDEFSIANSVCDLSMRGGNSLMNLEQETPPLICSATDKK